MLKANKSSFVASGDEMFSGCNFGRVIAAISTPLGWASRQCGGTHAGLLTDHGRRLAGDVTKPANNAERGG